MPWVSNGSEDNFASLTAMTWQVHAYGVASDALRDWCAVKGITLHVFDWRAEHERAGLAQTLSTYFDRIPMSRLPNLPAHRRP